MAELGSGKAPEALEPVVPLRDFMFTHENMACGGCRGPRSLQSEQLFRDPGVS